MGCSCRQRKSLHSVTVPLKKDEPTVMVEYTGDQSARRSYHLPSGHVYTFSAQEPRVAVAHRDLYWFLRQPAVFRKVG